MGARVNGETPNDSSDWSVKNRVVHSRLFVKGSWIIKGLPRLRPLSRSYGRIICITLGGTTARVLSALTQKHGETPLNGTVIDQHSFA